MPSPYNIPKICQYCGKEFMARLDHVRKSGTPFCSKQCATYGTRWKGGKTITKGYVILNKDKTREHRRIMEQVLGRPLLSSEIVHHKNENKADNRPENLEIMTRAQHAAHHIFERRAPSGWSLHYDCCIRCGTTKIRHNAKGLCHSCYQQSRKHR